MEVSIEFACLSFCQGSFFGSIRKPLHPRLIFLGEP